MVKIFHHLLQIEERLKIVLFLQKLLRKLNSFNPELNQHWCNFMEKS